MGQDRVRLVSAVQDHGGSSRVQVAKRQRLRADRFESGDHSRLTRASMTCRALPRIRLIRRQGSTSLLPSEIREASPLRNVRRAAPADPVAAAD
jgi:hypothetical protein